MIAGDLDLERALRDPAYLRSILEQSGLCEAPAVRPIEPRRSPIAAKLKETPYAR